MSKAPLKVGITGGIGSGKSLVGKIFNRQGVPLYDADSRAKWLMVNNAELKNEIIALFGAEAYNEQGLNRQHISAQAFNAPEILKQLNGLVHPKVGDFEQWVQQNVGKPYLLKEAALMFESDSYKQLDFIVAVSAPEKVRINRVLERDPHRTQKDVEKIIARQLTDVDRKERADSVINNDGTQLVIPQVLRLHEQFIRR